MFLHLSLSLSLNMGRCKKEEDSSVTEYQIPGKSDRGRTLTALAPRSHSLGSCIRGRDSSVEVEDDVWNGG